MIFKDEVHPRPTTATELCAFFLKAWAPIPMAYIKAYLHFVCTLHKQLRVTGMINCVFLNDLHLHT
jgi:hypothetical protein